MARAGVPSARLRALKRLVGAIRERGSDRPFGAPLSVAALDALEVQLGVPLPAEVRTFFGSVTGGEPGHKGVPPLLDPRVGCALLDAPSRPFPLGPDDVPALLERRSGEPAAAADVPLDGMLAISDYGCAIYDCVVLAGPLAGTVWQSWDGGLTPHEGARDGEVLSFLDWAERMLREALAAAPPRVRSTTRELDFLWSDVRLEAFPETVRRATGLERLVIASNPVRTLPQWIGELRQLRELMAGGCALQAVPESIGDCAALERLALSGNELRSLPESVTRLERLRVLDVWGNRLDGLPALETLPRLESLAVHSNALKDLARALPPSLTMLRLDDNPLRCLPESLASTRVRELRLEKLPALDHDASLAVLAALPSLETLALVGTRPSEAGLRGLTGLRTLRVIAAGWTELPRALAAMESLETLSLDQNRLDDLPPWLFDLPRLRAVYIFANPLAPERLSELRARHPGIAIEA